MKQTKKPEHASRSLLLFDRREFTREFLSDLLTRMGTGMHVHAVASFESLDDVDTSWNLILINVGEGIMRDPWARADLHGVAARFPDVPIAMLSNVDDPDSAFEALRNGVRGYLLHTLDARNLIAALNLVMMGGICITTAAEWRSAWSAHDIFDQASGPLGITPREAQVLEKLKQGKPNKLIAYELGMAENTVKVHVNRIMKKLGAVNRTNLVFIGENAGNAPTAGARHMAITMSGASTNRPRSQPR